MSNPRHAAPSRAAALAGRVALGVVGAPVAMLAVAGPASATAVDPGDNRLEMETDGSSFEVEGEMSEPTLRELDLSDFDRSGADSLPEFGALPSADDLAGLADLPGTDAFPGLDSLPGTDSLSMDSLPNMDSLPSTDSFPSVDSFPGLDSLRGFDSLPGTDSFPGTDALDIDALDTDAPELPLEMNLDLHVDMAATEDHSADLDVFSTSDLLGGLI